MAKTAKLFATVTIYWINRRGAECDCNVEVDYTFDGANDLNVIKACAVYVDADTIPDFDDLVWQAVSEYADEAYGEWASEYGEYMRDAAIDARAMGSYVPAQVVA